MVGTWAGVAFFEWAARSRKGCALARLHEEGEAAAGELREALARRLPLQRVLHVLQKHAHSRLRQQRVAVAQQLRPSKR